MNQEDIGKLYSRYPLTQLRVRLPGDDEKYLVIIGNEGKILSRAQSLQIVDIDKFVYRLSELLAHDYLSVDYIAHIKRMARNTLVGTDFQKDNFIDICYKEIRTYIQSKFPDISQPIAKIIINAFFYCIRENIFLEVDPIDFSLPNTVSTVLRKITKKEVKSINSLFTVLASAYDSSSEENCIAALDDLITNEKKAMRNASGF